MGRKLTTRNHAHPHYILKDFLQRVKREYRVLSVVEFKRLFDAEWEAYMEKVRMDPDTPCPTDWPKTRAYQMDWLVERQEAKLKRQWELNHGWPFNDIYDPEKLKQRVKEEMQRKPHEETKPSL